MRNGHHCTTREIPLPKIEMLPMCLQEVLDSSPQESVNLIPVQEEKIILISVPAHLLMK